MKITIDDKILSKYKLTKEQFFFMLSIAHKLPDNELDTLINKKYYISQSYNGGLPQQNFFLSHAGVDMINKIILESEHLGGDQKNKLEEIAKSMQALFPEGRKEGTNNYWRGNVPEIRNRMQSFFSKFGDYPEDVIIKATKKYIDSFGPNTRLMKTLKYFISKKRDDGSVEYDLLTFIENLNTKEGNRMETERLL